MTAREFYRMVAVCLPLAATCSTQAQAPTDCAAAKATLIPIELTYHVNDISYTTQLFRSADGNDVVWSKTQSRSRTAIGKTLVIDGRLSESQGSATSPEKLKTSGTKWEFDGLPKNFDRRRNLDYKAHTVTSFADGTTDDSTTQYSYKFKSESPIHVGSCTLTVVRGEMEFTNSKIADRKFHSAIIYFPELRLSANSTDSEIQFDDIKTSFTPLTQIQ